MRRHRYGRRRGQWVERWPPQGEPTGWTAVLVHGGFWGSAFGCGLMRPLAADLAADGWLVANLEYRRLGAGGGWPATFADVAAATDDLAGAESVHPDRVVAVGHSAGGQLALWLAARAALPPGAPGAAPAVVPAAAVSLAGVCDLVAAAEQRVGGRAVRRLLGGEPGEVPDRYALASPAARLPLGRPQLLVHGGRDRHVPPSLSLDYAEAARAAGDEVEVALDEAAAHMELIDPRSPAWEAVREWLDGRCP